MEKAQVEAVDRRAALPLDASTRDRLDAVSREHGPYLRELAARLCRRQFDPDDLVQDVLLTAAAELPRLGTDANVVGWLTRVLKNRFIDRCRRRQTAAVATPEQPIDEERIAARETEGEAWWEQLDAGDIRRALAQVAPELRAPFELFAFDGLSYHDIATRLAIPKATVGTRILRARQRLRAVLTAARDERGDR